MKNEPIVAEKPLIGTLTLLKTDPTSFHRLSPPHGIGVDMYRSLVGQVEKGSKVVAVRDSLSDRLAVAIVSGLKGKLVDLSIAQFSLAWLECQTETVVGKVLSRFYSCHATERLS